MIQKANLQVHRSMNTLEFPSKKEIIEIPAEWDECSVSQVRYILNKAFCVMNGKLSLLDFKVHVFSKFTGIKFGFLHFIREKLGMNKVINERIFQLSELFCSWVFDKNVEGNIELNYRTIRNNFPLLNDKFFGPADLLADITLNEFKTALSFLHQYFENCSDSDQGSLYLDYFIATIYRPKNCHGNRISFHKYIIEPSVFENVHSWEKQMIAIWFSYCVRCLQEEDIVIDGIDVNLSVLFPKSSSNQNNSQKASLGWTGIILDIAESGVFGDAESTGNTMLYDVLLYLLKKHQDQPKQK